MTSTRRRPSERPATALSLPSELQAVAAVLDRHAENPSAFLALNMGTRHFTADGVDGVIAYVPAGRSTVVQLGGVFAAPAEQVELLGRFRDLAQSQGRRIVAVQLMRQDAELYAAHGFRVNQFGTDYARGLADFSLRGKKHMQLRNKISRARRAGVTITELSADDLAAWEVSRALDDLDQTWLRAKGRHVKELRFMVGERNGPAQGMRRLFVARDQADSVLAYVSFSPVYGHRSGWLHDLSRRRPDAPPGVLELIVSSAVDTFQSEGAAHLHFGFTPFTGLSVDYEVPGFSGIAARMVRCLAEHGSAIYPAADQLAYKEKWGLDLVQPEYIAFQGSVSIRSVWNLLRLTNAA